MHVNWIKNPSTNSWYDFLLLNLDAPYFNNKKGVYVIWYANPSVAKVIRLGQGDIAFRLKEHRSNYEITKYGNYGTLKVTWAVIGEGELLEKDLDGVERFLAEKYNPIIGDRYPNVPSVPINLI